MTSRRTSLRLESLEERALLSADPLDPLLDPAPAQPTEAVVAPTPPVASDPLADAAGSDEGPLVGPLAPVDVPQNAPAPAPRVEYFDLSLASLPTAPPAAPDAPLVSAVTAPTTAPTNALDLSGREVLDLFSSDPTIALQEKKAGLESRLADAKRGRALARTSTLEDMWEREIAALKAELAAVGRERNTPDQLKVVLKDKNAVQRTPQLASVKTDLVYDSLYSLNRIANYGLNANLSTAEHDRIHSHAKREATKVWGLAAEGVRGRRCWPKWPASSAMS